MRTLIRILPIALLAVSCISIHATTTKSDDLTVLRSEQLDGVEIRWRLHANRAGEPLLERTEKRPREVADLGLRVRPLTRQRAAELDLPAFGGVVAESVRKRSSADVAGLKPGDVLLSLDGAPLTSPEQFSDVVLNDLAPGASLTLEARRGGADGVEAIQFALDADAKRIEDTATESLTLRGSAAVRDLTGLNAAELSAELAGEALASTDGVPVVLVAGVSPGSPAYLAGLRAGDRIVTLDGAPLAGLDRLVSAVLARADQRGLAISSNERTDALVRRAADGALELGVRGPLGEHRATLDVRDDLDERSEVDIPILFECESDLDSTRWSLLDFIFQFGANYRSRYVAATTREPARHSFFSMLPFGFYEVEKSPGRAHYTILWFIEWERRR
ncbi:MAG: PDZ domain-containing protein [Planctomycetota bacterium]